MSITGSTELVAGSGRGMGHEGVGLSATKFVGADDETPLSADNIKRTSLFKCVRGPMTHAPYHMVCSEEAKDVEIARLLLQINKHQRSIINNLAHVPREFSRAIRKRFARAVFHRSLRPLGWLRKIPFRKRGAAILVAADFLPLYDRQSGGLRLKNLIDIIGKLDQPIIFASVLPKNRLPGVLADDSGRTRYENVLRQAGVIDFAYGAQELEALLKDKHLELTYAFLSFPAVAKEFMPIVREFKPDAKIIYDMVDFHALRMEREAALFNDPKQLLKAEAMKALEISIAKAADVTIAVSIEEKMAMLELAPTAVVEVLPNIFEIPPGAFKGTEGRKNVLFVGGFWHKPNSDAVIWFVENIWPLIHVMAPDCSFIIAGSNPGPEVVDLAKHAGVDVIGYVEDLQPLYDSVRVCVAPLRYGAGVKGKVGQSMACGLPVVATSIGAEGMRQHDHQHILVADDPESFAAHVLNLLKDDALWADIQREGRRLIEASFSIDAVSDQVKDLFHD